MHDSRVDLAYDEYKRCSCLSACSRRLEGVTSLMMRLGIQFDFMAPVDFGSNPDEDATMFGRPLPWRIGDVSCRTCSP